MEQKVLQHLNADFCVALVLDSTLNMNALGRMIEEKYPTKHHFCTDHTIQLSAVKAYSGDG